MYRTTRWAATAMVALTFAVAASACSSDTSDVSSGTSEPGTTATTRPVGGTMMDTVPSEEIVTGDMLIGHTFVSSSVTGYELTPGTSITLSFTATDLSANAGCNTTGGAYTLAGGILTVTGELRTTMMACPEPLESQDGWLTTWLQSGVEVTATPVGISMTGDGVTVDFAQKLDAGAGGVAGAEGLIGPTWTVHSFTTADTVSSFPGPPPTFTFTEGRSVSVFTGCNSGTTTYSATDTTITFDPMITTMKACEQDAGGVIEQSILTLMTDGVTYSFDGGDLILTSLEGGVIASPS